MLYVRSNTCEIMVLLLCLGMQNFILRIIFLNMWFFFFIRLELLPAMLAETHKHNNFVSYEVYQVVLLFLALFQVIGELSL